MTNTQLFFAIVGVFAAQTTLLALYINAKIDPVREQVGQLVEYLVSHEGRVSVR